MMKWEYSIVSVPDSVGSNVWSVLNEAGKEGWELTGHETDTGYGVDYLMKRGLVEDDQIINLADVESYLWTDPKTGMKHNFEPSVIRVVMKPSASHLLRQRKR